MRFGNRNNWIGKWARRCFPILMLLTVAAGCLLASDLVREYRRERFWEEVRSLRDAGFYTDAELDPEAILPEYRTLYEKNPDMVGWLTIEWCRIDFPVMQTRDDPEHYLRLNFEGEKDDGGTPFIDFRCSVSPRRSYNLILYGHYTDGDRLFRRLLEYAYENRASEHREFRFDTLEESGIYEVEAAFYHDATDSILNPCDSNTGEQAYMFYNYIELDSEEGFRLFAEGIRERTLYSWEPQIASTDQLLTIVCCAPKPFSGIENEGRFVVVAKKK